MKNIFFLHTKKYHSPCLHYTTLLSFHTHPQVEFLVIFARPLLRYSSFLFWILYLPNCNITDLDLPWVSLVDQILLLFAPACLLLILDHSGLYLFLVSVIWVNVFSAVYHRNCSVVKFLVTCQYSTSYFTFTFLSSLFNIKVINPSMFSKCTKLTISLMRFSDPGSFKFITFGWTVGFLVAVILVNVFDLYHWHCPVVQFLVSCLYSTFYFTFTFCCSLFNVIILNPPTVSERTIFMISL